MTFNPFEDSFQGLGDKATSGAKTLQDVLEWLERDECPLGVAARRTYTQAVRKAARLIGRAPDRIPACTKQFQSKFPNRAYARSWGKTFCAAKRWKRNVSAAINGATGIIAAQKERRSRRDEWASLLAVLGEIAEKGSPSPFELHPKQLICIQSCADTARKLEIRVSDIDPDVALCLYRAAPTKAAKDAVVEALDLVDQSRVITDRRIQRVLPAQPIGFVRPERAEKVAIPGSLVQELETWVHLATRGRWSITDNAFVAGVSPTPYFNAAKKILTTAERAGALKLAELSTIASAFDELVLVAVVQMLRDLHKNDEAGAITPRTARGYFECLVPLLERNGEDTSSVRMILDTDRWLKTGRRSRTEMAPHVRSFCRSVVTDMNARIRFLSLHIQLRKKAILHLKAAQMTTGREAERHLEKARRFGTCAGFAALETDAIPARVSSVLKTTFRGSGAWLCLGHRKADDGRLMIPAAYVKNRKPLFATMSATSRLRGLETLRWYEEFMRPLFSDHQDNDHFFPAVQKPGQPLSYATFKSWWSDCAAECGFPGLNPHMFRHGQASILVAENPGNWSLVAARLGDTEAVCRDNYAWIDHEKLVLAGQRELTKEFPSAA
ncbi:site-specific integrase [Salipiger bermudensis]|uniref:site-specific integrase n=1 Tax=Salipiger bermudensis TaxID=344736 RepID=UPI001A8CA50B|nr:site-specific integrase [Salipiger bermudensis]MBN9675964.1 site-specific integrase [Salipiger bermudensis]